MYRMPLISCKFYTTQLALSLDVVFSPLNNKYSHNECLFNTWSIAHKTQRHVWSSFINVHIEWVSPHILYWLIHCTQKVAMLVDWQSRAAILWRMDIVCSCLVLTWPGSTMRMTLVTTSTTVCVRSLNKLCVIYTTRVEILYVSCMTFHTNSGMILVSI